MLLASNILNDADRNTFGIEGASIYSAQIVVFFTLFPFREWKNFIRFDKKTLIIVLYLQSLNTRKYILFKILVEEFHISSSIVCIWPVSVVLQKL